jgi:DNA-3-methyladenine glycosylase II
MICRHSMNHETFVTHFKKTDPLVAGLISAHGEYQIPQRGDFFDALIRSILGQQVSTKAAQAVYNKLLSRYNQILDPGILRLATQEELREVGISRQKYSYIVDLSEHFIEKQHIFESLDSASDQEVIESLTQIKGIGVWTAQMFLMFTLGRLDVFPIDDLGIRHAMYKLYDLPKDSPRKLLIQKSEPWTPYRSVACWHLWKSLH